MIKWLGEITKEDAWEVGNKAASLGELMKAGFPVPNGFVVTERATYGVRDAWEKLGAKKVAVRSSATAEDLMGDSFAGVYDTHLNVKGWWKTCDAVSSVFDSVDSKRAKEYLEDRSPINNRMSVIVQEMVPADSAGVMFTMEPVRLDDRLIYIEAAEGLGEALVSGSVTPEGYTINKNPFTILERPDYSLLTTSNLTKLAFMGLMIEDYFRSPQDIEFAISEDKVWICQARPITT